jgi:adhesin/invasin
MLTQLRRRRSALYLSAACGIATLPFSSACDKVPLLAPTGTVITLFPAASTVPINGQVEIVATVIENGTTAAPPSGGTGASGASGGGSTTTTSSTGAGTPVQNGTVVTFTTTLGRIEPTEARTNNGQVHVQFIAGGQSGTATITAFSGGASGRIENLKVGSAAAERVILTATPQTLGASGGASDIAARVEDVSGLGLVGLPVNFTADAGTLSAGTSTTDSNGVAHVTLTTTRKSTVTANVAGKTATVIVDLNPRTGISITPPTGQVSAQQAAVFTVNVATGANIRNVSINWGDGTTTNLGAISASTAVQHTYDADGTFTVTATATDASGFSESTSTVIRVQPAQPPGVTLIASNSNPRVGQIITFTATVTGNTSAIQSFDWDFGDGTTARTTSPQITKSYATTGTKVIRVTVNQASGPSGQTQITVEVQL